MVCAIGQCTVCRLGWARGWWGPSWTADSNHPNGRMYNTATELRGGRFSRVAVAQGLAGHQPAVVSDKSLFFFNLTYYTVLLLIREFFLLLPFQVFPPAHKGCVSDQLGGGLAVSCGQPIITTWLHACNSHK